MKILARNLSPFQCQGDAGLHKKGDRSKGERNSPETEINLGKSVRAKAHPLDIFFAGRRHPNTYIIYIYILYIYRNKKLVGTNGMATNKGIAISSWPY